MGNQLTGIAPSQILPVEHYLTDAADYKFECSLGSTRFFKVAKASTQEGYVVVKVFVIHDPSLPLSSYKTRLDDICQKLQGTSNCLPFQKSLQFDKAALLSRQYFKHSLYDRISTRPFLNNIEKKWIAFQLLCALNQCHKLKVCHGDIKSENVMITGWNWLLLTDFASFKPTYLPDDNPSDFSYFFDTSRRRTCYISPERFVDGGGRYAEAGGQSGSPGNLDLSAYNDIKTGDLTPAMDIFSAGCVITELFTEGTPPFDLSQLLAYRNREYSAWKVLEKIEDNGVRELVRHMMQKDPNHRLSAEEYLIQQRVKTFPEYFYTFLKLYVQRFATPPILSPDDRIFRIKKDMDLILKNLKIEESQPENNSVLVLIISLVGSSLRKAHFCHAKLMALSLLTDLAKYVTADILLDRILPYLIVLVNDKDPRIRAEMLNCITECLKQIENVPRSDSNVFQEYIFPNLSILTQDSATIVRLAYAQNIAKLAETALKVLEMMQLNDNDDADDGETDMSSYDLELQTLQEIIQEKVVLLLNDPDNTVKRTLLENGIQSLCVFFGRQKANDVILSHMITFLNDKTDWYLRGAFFDDIVGIASYVGWQSADIIKPLLEQGLSDTEDFIVHKTLGALKSLTELGLLQKTMLNYFVKIVVPLLAHPGMWVRQGSAGFLSAIAKKLNIADIHCNLLPTLQPFLKTKILQIDKEVLLLNALQDPVPQKVFDYIIRSNTLERLFSTLQERSYMRDISRQGHKAMYSEMDDTMSQIFKKLQSLGCNETHEDKILALKDFIMKLHRARAGSAEPGGFGEERKPGSINILSLRKAPLRRHADLYKPKDGKSDGSSSPNTRRKKKSPGPDTPAPNMNPEWKSMFGSNSSDKSLSSSPKSIKSSTKSDYVAERKNITPTGSVSSSTSSLVTVSQLSIDSSIRSGTIKGEKLTQQTRYNPCKLDLRTLVHKRRGQYASDIATRDQLEGISWDSRPPPSNWKPKGQLVAHLHEHRSAVNRISVCYDHSYFATCSNDGLIKLWECGKLEGKNICNRSKQTIKQGASVKLATFFEGTHKLAAASDNGAIHVYELDSGRATQCETQTVNTQNQGHVVDLLHFDTGNQSVLAYATVNGNLIGWDLRSPDLAWVLKNDPKTGLITSFAVHQSQCWLAVGTSSGSHVCWDLRFQLPITSIVHPAESRVRKLIAHPIEQSWIISATQWNNEVSMWDIETGIRRKALWASSVPTFSKTQASPHAIYGMHIGVTDSSTFLITGGSDMRVRFWDLNYASNSFIMAPAASDPYQQTSVNYRSRLVEGTEVTEETYSKKHVNSTDIPRRGPEAPATGHTDIITDVNLCRSSQCLVLTSSRNGVVKVWK